MPEEWAAGRDKWRDAVGRGGVDTPVGPMIEMPSAALAEACRSARDSAQVRALVDDLE